MSQRDRYWKRHLFVVGGQFGSEGKGRIVEKLGGVYHWDVSVRVGGPQAGHTVAHPIEGDYAFRSLPCLAANRDSDAALVIGPGAVIEPERLIQEVEDNPWVDGRVFVDRQATLLTSQHKEREADLVRRIGSTGKGVGEARVDKVRRKATIAQDIKWPDGIQVFDTIPFIHSSWVNDRILFEGAQGLGLSLNSSYYPKVTSTDCGPLQLAVDSGLSAKFLRSQIWETLGVYRTFPIRVAGDSGPLVDETTWEGIGQEPEYTTVTKKVRRVGLWDRDLAIWSSRRWGIDRAAITFLDYLEEEEWDPFINQFEEDTEVPVEFISIGPGEVYLADGDIGSARFLV